MTPTGSQQQQPLQSVHEASVVLGLQSHEEESLLLDPPAPPVPADPPPDPPLPVESSPPHPARLTVEEAPATTKTWKAFSIFMAVTLAPIVAGTDFFSDGVMKSSSNRAHAAPFTE